jgi:hypothetical protein
MKKKFTLKSIGLVVFSLFLMGTLNAQKTVTKTVAPSGGDYTTVIAALLDICSATPSYVTPVLAEGDNVIINVSGDIIEPVGTLFPSNIGVINTGGTGVNILIQGDKADNTFLTGPLPTAENRWLQFGTATLGGVTFKLKNLTFRNWGALTTFGVGNGGVMMLNPAITNGKMKAIFENVVLSGNSGRSVVAIWNSGYNVEFINCLFKDNIVSTMTSGTTAQQNNLNGLIYKQQAEDLKVQNCTFINNVIKPLTAANFQGGLVNYNIAASKNGNFVFEGNVAVNNRYDAAASTSEVKSMVNCGINSSAVSLTFSIKNNIMIGNKRDGGNSDVDFYFPTIALITPLASEGNIVNTAIDGTLATIELPGFKIDPGYTYTDPRINFTMDGQLPKLTNDGNGIGKTAHSGNGSLTGLKSMDRSFKIFPVNQSLRIEGLTAGTSVEVYNIMGSLVKSKLASSVVTEFDMLAKGVYIVKIGLKSQKVVVY